MEYMTLNELCSELSISLATGRNWLKLGKIKESFLNGDKPLFAKEQVDKLKTDIILGNNSALKSRRNKKYVSGKGLYSSYVSASCKGVSSVQKVLDIVEDEEIRISKDSLRLILADCALKLFRSSDNERVSAGKFDPLIRDLIKGLEQSEFSLDINYEYEQGEDILGLLYISLKNIGHRKAEGVYYTPSKVVRRLIDGLDLENAKRDVKILDPCCGSGNFLMQLPKSISFDSVYGSDIDPVSVMLTRINMALKYPDAPIEAIYEHICVKNYILNESHFDTNIVNNNRWDKYDYIIGNPPWGYSFTEDESKKLKELYRLAVSKNIESYDVFLERALGNTDTSGRVAFVLPQAILNVKSHMPVREIICSCASVKRLEFLGDVFDSVQCPSIILDLEYTGKKMSTLGMRVTERNRSFEIGTDRRVIPEIFSFALTDDEYLVLNKLETLKDAATLKDNADFALGIVTGNNKKYISDTQTEGSEMVLRGSDISRYCINDSGSFITFTPENFQQVAATEYYRAKEKLFYRFISNKLVFAYDNKGLLSLNSCNIVIPRIKGLEMKYVLAILNSSVAQFIYKKKFDSVKVLRSHIEAIPIPRADSEIRNKIISLVDEISSELGYETPDDTEIYEEIDNLIFALYGLSDKEIKTILSAIAHT